MTGTTQLTPIGGSRRYGLFGPTPEHPFVLGTQLTAIGGSRRYGSFADKAGAPSGPHDWVLGTQLTAIGGSRRYGSFVKTEPVYFELEPPLYMAVVGHAGMASSGLVTAAEERQVVTTLLARATVTVRPSRYAAVAGMRYARATVVSGPYVAPTLPLEVPEPSRTLAAQASRLGASPVLKAPPRLG